MSGRSPAERETAGENRYLDQVIGNFDRKDDWFCDFIRGNEVTTLRWGDLEATANSFLAAYRQLRLEPGALILIFLPHVPELYGSFLGAMLGGFVPSFMPCPSAKQDPEIYWGSHRQLFDRVRPAVLVASRATLDQMAANGLDLQLTEAIALEEVRPALAVPRPPSPDSIALLQHSSGTTGQKKGVALSYRAILSQIESYKAAVGISERDVIVSWLPLYHDMGLIACFLLPLYAGVPFVHLDPFEWAVQPGKLLEHITRRRGTLTWLPNFAFEHLAAVAGRDANKFILSSVRAFINCSEVCKPASFDRFERAFSMSGVTADQLQCCYAMAETVFAVTQTRLGRAPARIRVDRTRLDHGSVVRPSTEGGTGCDLVETGQLIPGARVTVFDEQRLPVPERTVGEVAISGEFLFSGYNRDPERTRTQLRDGVYFTRDLGFISDGSLYVLGRIDDLIIINGRNIYAHEIEQLLAGVDGIKPGRCVALPWEDERIGTQGLVVVAERSASTMRLIPEMRADIVSRIFSVTAVMAKAVYVVEEGWLVKTTSGKISREMNLKKLAAIHQHAQG